LNNTQEREGAFFVHRRGAIIDENISKIGNYLG